MGVLVGMIVSMTGFVLVLCFGLGLVGVGLLMGVMSVIFFGRFCAFVDVNFCSGDATAVNLFYLERCVDIQRGYGLVEDFGIDSGVDESPEKHIAANAGEAVEIGDAHGVIVSRGTDGRGGKKGLIHRAGAVAFGVDSDVEESEWLDGGGDLCENREREGARKVFDGDFDAGDVAVVADADLREAEGVKGGFGLLDLREVFAGDGPAVLDARGEASGGGFIGEREVGFAG